MEDVIVGLVVGFLGGFAGGLLGIGGGAIYVPAMVLILGEEQKLAQGVSLAAIVATGLIGTATNLRRSNVDVPTVAWVAPAAVAAGFGAALLADSLEGEVLRRIFAVVALYLGLQMIVGVLRTSQRREGEAS